MTGTNFQVESSAVSDRGLSEKRPQNEDSYLELKKQGLFAVADGVGGAQAGEVASQMAMEILGEAFINLPKNGDAEDLMKVAIERANEAIFQMSHDLAQLSSMATTIVALHLAGNIATIGHVGDSRLYRLDAKGNFYRETQDHSVVEEEVRAGRMTPEQAIHHPSRNVISRALGAEQTVEVDLKTIMIEPNTTFLICSDGITRHIDDFQLRELLLFKDTPANTCQRMKEICYERGAEDNLTAVIARVSDQMVESVPEEIIAAPADLEESTVATARQAQPGAEELQSPETTTPEPEREEKIYRADPKNESNSSGNLLSYLGLLLLGAILGATAYYLWAQNKPKTELPPTTQVQTPPPNSEFLSFENSRRSVDRDPTAYINKISNPPPDAEGLYLLGRAYLLAGKFPEAKKSFEDAKNQLALASEVNARIVGNEIAMGLAIIDDPAAQNKFQSQIKPSGSETDLQTNSNTNTVIR